MSKDGQRSVSLGEVLAAARQTREVMSDTAGLDLRIPAPSTRLIADVSEVTYRTFESIAASLGLTNGQAFEALVSTILAFATNNTEIGATTFGLTDAKQEH